MEQWRYFCTIPKQFKSTGYRLKTMVTVTYILCSCLKNGVYRYIVTQMHQNNKGKPGSVFVGGSGLVWESYFKAAIKLRRMSETNSTRKCNFI
jgi:hypothetical protein